MNSDGEIIVVDSLNGRIQIFDDEGFVSISGSTDSVEDLFDPVSGNKGVFDVDLGSSNPFGLNGAPGKFQIRASIITLGGELFSDPATITILPAPLEIIEGPKNAAGLVGDEATFSVTANGATTYQWYIDGTAVPGEVGPTFTTDASHPVGLHWVHVELNGGAIESSRVFLIVDEPEPETLTQGFLSVDFYSHVPGAQLFGGPAPLYDQPKFVNRAFDFQLLIPGATSPQTSPNQDNFAAVIHGYVKAPSAGPYNFFTGSDDASEFFSIR